MKIDDTLSQVFDVTDQTEKLPTPTQEDVVLPVAPAEERIESDYETTRQNLHVLLAQGQDALMHALEVAKQSEHPRAFEVVGNIMKQIADVNQQLMDLHHQKQKLDNPKVSKQEKNVTNNSIFVGSTAELNKFISEMKTGE